MDAHSDYPWLKSYPKFVDWHAAIPQLPAYAGFLNAVKNYPDNICLEFLGNFWTYEEIGHMAARAAKGFQKIGVTKGTRVALMLPNTHYYVLAYMGTLLAGGTVVNVNSLYADRELEHLVKDAGADILVTMDLAAMYPKARKILDITKLKKLIVCSMTDAMPTHKGVLFSMFRRKTLADVKEDPLQMWFDELLDNRGDYERVAINPTEDIAVFQYTGGSLWRGIGALAAKRGGSGGEQRDDDEREKSKRDGDERGLAEGRQRQVAGQSVDLLEGVGRQQDPGQRRQHTHRDRGHDPLPRRPWPEEQHHERRQVGARRDVERPAHQETNVEVPEQDAKDHRHHPQPHGSELSAANLLVVCHTDTAHVLDEIVGHGAAASHNQPADGAQHGRERDRRNDREQRLVERLGQ